jgi:thiamine biosynthesis lipoprotein
MRQVEQIMGIPISIDIPDAADGSAFEAAFARLKQIDGRFSLYKPESEASRLANGEITENQTTDEMKRVIRACRQAEAKTDGYFSAWAGGSFDPSGYVKGWAIAEAGKSIEESSYKTFCIGAGGDILACSAGEKVWEIGIQNPRDKTKILNLLSISNGAVATSGTYERGKHIINPRTRRPADGLLSVSVTGPDIVWADVLATAVFAMGKAGKKFMKSQPGYQALIIAA